jgi:hypothetical protein
MEPRSKEIVQQSIKRSYLHWNPIDLRWKVMQIEKGFWEKIGKLLVMQ